MKFDNPPLIDLKPFYEGARKKEYMREYSEGCYTYATDGCILIRVDRRENVNKFHPFIKGAIGIFQKFDISLECEDLSDINDEAEEKLEIFVYLGGHKYDLFYLQMMKKLPNLRVFPSEGTTLFFTFDGGIGCLMAVIEMPS